MEMHNLQGIHLRRYAQVSWQHGGTRRTHYALGGYESKAPPPLHCSTSHQNPTTSISMDIAPHHLHPHKRAMHNSPATLRWISFSAQQLAPRHITPQLHPPDTHTGFRPPIPTRHLHIIIPYCHIFPSWFFHSSGIMNYTSGAFLPRQRSGVARR
jgi:hypothetical protein